MAKKIIKILFFAVYRIKINFEEKEEDNVFTIASKSRRKFVGKRAVCLNVVVNEFLSNLMRMCARNQ